MNLKILPAFPRPAAVAAGAALLIALAGPSLAQDAQDAPAEAPSTQPAANLPTGEQVLKKYVEATGGEAAYEALTGQTATGTFEMPGMGYRGELEVYQKVPGKMLIVVTIPDVGTIERGLNGDVAWQVDQLEGPQLFDKEQRQAMLRDADPQSAVHPDRYFSSIENKGVEDVDGKPAYHLVFTPKDGGVTSDSYYEVETGLLVKSVATHETPAGESKTETLLSDYREVGQGELKMKQPFKIVTNVGGLERVMVMKKIAFNADVPDDKFDVPPEVKKLADEGEADDGGAKM